MAELTLRTVEGRALTNQEVDDNFTNLNADIIALNADVDEINNTTIPNEVSALEILIGQKQDLNAKLTSLSGVSANGLLSISGNVITPRTIQSDSLLLTITNPDGVAGNPTLTLSSNILTNTSTHTLSNKTISGNNNTITNVSLTTSVTGLLPLSNGGTNAGSAADARTNLEVLRRPGGTGIVVKTGADSSTTRTLAAGAGIVITNETGVSNNPSIAVDPALISAINSIQNGATGAVGLTGATGMIGATGAKGDAGPAGAAGATGVRGASGVNGATGAAGINGASGVGGATGPKGDTGPAGAVSAAGATGATGAAGATGIAGINGASGVGGATGPKGDTGPAGAQGASGVTPSVLTLAVTLVFEGRITNGTCNIVKQSGGVASVTRTAKGRYSVAFNSGVFSDANYCVSHSVSTFNVGNTTRNHDHVVNIGNTTTTLLELDIGDMRADANNIGHDADRVHIMIAP